MGETMEIEIKKELNLQDSAQFFKK